MLILLSHKGENSEDKSVRLFLALFSFIYVSHLVDMDP